MGSIAAEREEILRLINRISRGAPRRGAPARIPPADESRRAQDLKLLRQARERLEARVQVPGAKSRGGHAAPALPDSVLELLQRLERRVSAIEARLGLEAERAAQPPSLSSPSSPSSTSSPSPSSPEAPAQLPGHHALSGNVREGFLADILQLVSSNDMTGVFTVEHNGTRVQLYYREGEVFHADGEELSGETAFFTAMALEDGRFYFTETNDLPEERTINAQTQFLILEALRQIDEARARDE